MSKTFPSFRTSRPPLGGFLKPRPTGVVAYFLETFVDPSRFRGTCYRAANWLLLGRTTGRGHNAPTKKPRVPVKEILGYPLSRRFRQLLSHV